MRSRSVPQQESLSQISLAQAQTKQEVSGSPIVVIRRASGGFALIDSLKRHGVEHIFGYPGGAILPIYDE